jgi:hypothetical protein
MTEEDRDNIKMLLKGKDVQKVWSGITMLTQVWIQRKEVDTVVGRK